MQPTISVTLASGDSVLSVDVAPTSLVETLKQVVLAETGMPVQEQVFLYQGRVLFDKEVVTLAGVKGGDIIQVERLSNLPPAQREAAVPTLNNIPRYVYANPALLQEYINSQPKLLQRLLQANPTMAEAVLSQDPSFLGQVIMQQAMERQAKEAQAQAEIARMNADPMNPEYQRRIAEQIRLQNVQENMEQAIEYQPESFGRVVMLYVPCRVNGHEINAFVDSGAQSTIMSESCARRVGLLRLLDTRFQGIAKGVGSAKILGRIHAAPIRMGNKTFQCSFTVLEGDDMEFLFGLDQLKHHQAVIDLKKNALLIAGEEIPFLAEKDLGRDEREVSVGPDVSSSQPSATAGTSAGGSAPASSSSSSASAAAAAAATAPTAGTTPAAAAGGFPEDVVTRLMGLGFPREAVVQALQLFGGNAEAAASHLFSSGGFGW